MVLLLDAEEVEDDPAVAVAQHVGCATGGIGPKRQRRQVQHGLDLLVEIGRAAGAFELGEVDARIRRVLQVFQALLGLADDGQVFVEDLLVLAAGLAGERLGVVVDRVEQTGHLAPLGGVAQGIAEQAIKDQLRIAFARDRIAVLVVGDVAAADLVGEQALGGQFQRTMRRVLANLVRDELIDRRRFRVLVMTGEEAAGGVGVRREAEVAHVVEDQQVLLVMREGLHQGRHAEVEFRAAVDVPGGRVHAVGLEQRHEPHRRLPAICRLCRGLHQVEPRQRQRGAHAAQEGPSIEFQAHGLFCQESVSTMWDGMRAVKGESVRACA